MPDAIINALGTIAAAFVGVVTWYLASRHDRQREAAEREAQRQAEERLRDQRVLDIVVALHSEILAGHRGKPAPAEQGRCGICHGPGNPLCHGRRHGFRF